MDPVWNSGQQLDNKSLRRAVRRHLYAHVIRCERVSRCVKTIGLWQSIMSVGQVCDDVTEATSSYFGALLERYSTKFLATTTNSNEEVASTG